MLSTVDTYRGYGTYQPLSPSVDAPLIGKGSFETVRVPIRGPSDFNSAVSDPSRIAARFENTNTTKKSGFFFLRRHDALLSSLAYSPSRLLSLFSFLAFSFLSLVFLSFSCPSLLPCPFSLWISCRRSDLAPKDALRSAHERWVIDLSGLAKITSGRT